jgi:diamine N-acetyltransferase
LALAFEEVRMRGGKEIYTSWVPGEASPEPFYLGLGFAPTGEVDDGEIVARLQLDDAKG